MTGGTEDNDWQRNYWYIAIPNFLMGLAIGYGIALRIWGYE